MNNLLKDIYTFNLKYKFSLKNLYLFDYEKVRGLADFDTPDAKKYVKARFEDIISFYDHIKKIK